MRAAALQDLQDTPARTTAVDRQWRALMLHTASRADFESFLEHHVGPADAAALSLRRALLEDRGEDALAIAESGMLGSPDESLLRGRVLLHLGRFDEGVEVLRALLEATEAQDADELLVRALALRLLGVEDGVEQALMGALSGGADRLGAGVALAELLLEQGRHGEASALLRVMLRDAPWHPEVWATSARLAMATDRDGERAGLAVLAAETLSVFPARGALLRAELDVVSGRAREALLGARLAIAEGAPVDRGVATLLLAAGLVTDEDALGRSTEHLHRLPGPGRLLSRVAVDLERRYRYPQALALHELAVEHRRDHEPSSLLLTRAALARSRAMDDAGAVELLRMVQAGEDVHPRAERLLAFHEEVLAVDYVDAPDPRRPGVTWRLHRDEAAVLLVVLSEVLDEVVGRYEARYGIPLPVPLRVEVFREPESFGLRAFGEPDIAPHGYCFGNVLAIRSPHAGDFNWRHVLEHELSHVFTLAASSWAVPRWFTEGAAEWDVIERWPSWRRRADLQVARSLRSGRLPRLEELDEAYLRRASMSLAYHQSFLAVEWLVERFGPDIVPRLVRAFGEEDGDVERSFERETGWTLYRIDREFRESLGEALRPLVRLYEPDPQAYLGSGDPGDPLRAWFSGTPAGMQVARSVAERSPSDPAADWVLARLAVAEQDDVSWGRHVERLERRGLRSATLWWRGGDLALELGALDDALARYSRAVDLAPELVDAWANLGVIAVQRSDVALAETAFRRVEALDAGDWSSRYWLLDHFRESGRLREAADVATQMVWIRPLMAPELRSRVIESLVAAGEDRAAMREIRIARLAGAHDPERLDALYSLVASRCPQCGPAVGQVGIPGARPVSIERPRER
ncbi:MAG: hypothetical protein EA398_04460 [Deltaproteobacteria bacterium]|nr:MAG: hypothetical protein EA398_04460 [Deltaproteobacteria bacterium]